MTKAKSKQKPETKSRQKIKRRRVTFSLETAEVQDVILMGDFNNWNPKTHPMKYDGNGVWNKTVILSPGEYEYKFLIDGSWVEDPLNDQTCPNCFGTRNCIINVTAS